jgi:hypothetical protein
LVLNGLGDYLMLDEHLKIVFLLCPSNLEEFSKVKKKNILNFSIENFL